MCVVNNDAQQFLYRRAGAGVRANRRHLPLAYLMGFRHVFMRFQGKVCGHVFCLPFHSALERSATFCRQKSWLSRHRAMRRALEAIQSRRTLANATGQKYALLTAPGEHWVHWPDKYGKPDTRIKKPGFCLYCMLNYVS